MEENSAIQNLYDQDGLLDILLGVEKYFDDMDLFAYKNWIYGELVEGPIVSKYWVEVTFKYDHDTFPDPMGTKVLEQQGTKVYIKRDFENTPIAFPRSRNDMEAVGTQSGSVSLPKDERIPIILYKFQIPRRIVNPESFDEYKLIASTFNKNAEMEDEEQPEPDMSMENEEEVQEMDDEFGQGNNNPMGGM
jgi:hypothetical protein